MRYIPTDKYTVAWFKLAECVAKGEKEKAFGVYRLLMHSLEDKAYAYQLEGDLLGAFQDDRALEKYEHAAELYVANQRWKEAIALYEELALMNPDNVRAVHCLLELYSKYKKPEQCVSKILRLALTFYEKRKWDYIEQLVDTLAECTITTQDLQQCSSFCLLMITHNNLESRVIEKIVCKTTAYALMQTNNNQLSQFLTQLEQVNSNWYECAQNYIASSESR